MRLLILGDCHERLDLVHRACTQARERDGIEAAIQVGDFGLSPRVLHRFLHEGPRRFPVPLHVIDGNHEDHAWLHACRTDGTVATWSAANLHVHPRGTVLELGGARIGLLGGALHADRAQEWSRSNGDPSKVPRDPTWANWVTEGDIDRALTAFGAGPLDLLVTHSCPAGIGVGMHANAELVDYVARFIRRAGHHSGPLHDCGEGNLTRLWKELPTRPPLWVFGHFHQLHERQVGATRFICVGSTDDSDGVVGVRPVLYDTATRAVVMGDLIGTSTGPPGGDPGR